MRVLRDASEEFGYDDEDYFETFEEVLTPDEEKKATETLDKVSKTSYNIRQEVNKPHKCSPNCICKVINIELDLINAHANELRRYINGKQQRKERDAKG